MMTHWMTKTPGEGFRAHIIGKEEDDLPYEGVEILCCDLMYPDWVRLPPEIVHDGNRCLRVVKILGGACLTCKAPSARHYDLEEGFSVCECVACERFSFYRTPTEEK